MFFTICNFELLINNMDASLLKHLSKVARFEKYAIHRKIPQDIIVRVKSYYDYQWKLLHGIEEQRVSNRLDFVI